MKKTIVLLCVVSAGIWSGCAQKCEQAKKEVLEPMQRVQAYLALKPSATSLKNNGCTWIQSTMDNLMDGAKSIRKLAKQRYNKSKFQCVQWETWTREVCPSHRAREAGFYDCVDHEYRRCAKRVFNKEAEPIYREAIQFASDVDLIAMSADHLCNQAHNGDEASVIERRETLQKDISRIVPKGWAVYGKACGRN